MRCRWLKPQALLNVDPSLQIGGRGKLLLFGFCGPAFGPGVCPCCMFLIHVTEMADALCRVWLRSVLKGARISWLSERVACSSLSRLSRRVVFFVQSVLLPRFLQLASVG